jgi:hypothetical protein
MLEIDRRVDTENNETAGSEGGGEVKNPDLVASSVMAWTRKLSYSENDKLLLELVLFRRCDGMSVSKCSLEDLEVMPVEALSCEPVEPVLA